tara:strand:- start:2095 stop:2271 length:177 start_codon:yes stop_codon:yes gene_type:complete
VIIPASNAKSPPSKGTPAAGGGGGGGGGCALAIETKVANTTVANMAILVFLEEFIILV